MIGGSASDFFADLEPHDTMPQRSAPKEVQEYFESLPDAQREQLGALRSHLRRVWPGAVEDFSYRMPTYCIDGKPAFALAAQKSTVVLHVIAYDLLHPFKNDLMRFDCGPACIRIRVLTPALEDLIDRVIKYVGSQIHTSQHSTRPTRLRASASVK